MALYCLSEPYRLGTCVRDTRKGCVVQDILQRSATLLVKLAMNVARCGMTRVATDLAMTRLCEPSTIFSLTCSRDTIFTMA
jgi:hypothetical protein